MSPTSKMECLMIWSRADVIIMEINCTANVIHLYHPETILSSPRKNCLPRSGSWCQKGWGPLSYNVSFQLVRIIHWTIQQNEGSWVCLTHTVSRWDLLERTLRKLPERMKIFSICWYVVVYTWVAKFYQTGNFAYNLDALLYLNFTWTILEK